jgi:Sulfotransferase domain
MFLVPVYRNISVSELARSVKAFLRQEAGLARGKAQSKNLERQLARTQKRLNQTRQQLAEVRSRKDTPIFFVVGRPKSGTSWLQATLGRHPEILCRGEGEFFGRDYGNGQPKANQILLYDIRPPSRRSLYTALAQSEPLRRWIERSTWTHGDDTEEHIANLTREAIYYFLTERLSKSNNRIVGDKTPFASPEIIKEISVICPEAKVIHIIRDGRDVAVSQLHHMWRGAAADGGWFHVTPEELHIRDRYWKDPQELLGSGEGIFTEGRLREAAEGWKSDVGAAHRDGPVLLGDNYTEVRYEDMLERPEEEFGRLFRFLGARAGKDRVARCVEATSFEKRSGGRERGQEDPRSHERKGIAGDWRNVFTERDRIIFKEIAGDLLIELGYEKPEA